MRKLAGLLTFCSLLGGTPLWAQNYIEIVREEKAKLVDAGYDFHLVLESDPDGSEESRRGAAEITWRVAHRLSQMGHAVFLIWKNPAQNGATAPNGQRYSHDAIVFNGVCIDMLFRSETRNEPAWNTCTNPVVEPALWRPTFPLDEMSPAPQPQPHPQPRPEPTPSNNGDAELIVSIIGDFQQQTNTRLEHLETQLDAQAAQLAAHDAKVDEFRKEARGWVDTLKNPKTWIYSGGIAAILAIVQQYLGEPQP